MYAYVLYTRCETTLSDDDMYNCLSLSVYVNIYSLNNDNNDNNINNNTNNNKKRPLQLAEEFQRTHPSTG